MDQPPEAAPGLTFRPHGFFTILCNQKFVLAAGRGLRLRQKADWLLKLLPIWVSGRNGIRRKIDSVESLFAGEEIFSNPIYQFITPWLPEIKSFVDLGVNRGYFTLYLNLATAPFRSGPLFGFGVDANPTLIKVAEGNLKANKLDFIALKHAVVGVKTRVPFYLDSIDTLSGLFEVNALGEKGPNQMIEVDPICVGQAWKELFGSASCDLLKIDIEGAEALFIDLEADFVRTIKYIVVEYHGALTTTREAIENRLIDLGFIIEAHELNLHKSGVLFARLKTDRMRLVEPGMS
jgi:FkbM family methyltransferase